MSEEAEEAQVSEVKKKPSVQKYKAKVGISYKGKHLEPGDIASDIPEESLGWLLEGNYIVKVK